MSRGIVMETGHKYVILLMPDGQFRKVPTGRKPQVGEEFSFTEQRRFAQPRKLYSFSAGAAAILLLLFVPFLLNHMNQGPQVVAYLTMDVNPSIELGITADEHVEELRAINNDGVDVTEGLAYKGLTLEQVTEAIMDRISAGPYLNSGEGDVIITSVLVANPAESEYENTVTTHMDAAVRKSLSKTDKGRKLKVEVTTLSAPKEIRDEAKQDGLSAGKLAFYLMAKKQGHKVTIEQLKTQSIHKTAKPWGGVKAVINDNNKPAPSVTKNGQEQGDTAQKPEEPTAAQTKQTWEQQKEQQREQLRELLKKEQEKRERKKDDRRGNHSGSDNKSGSKDNKDHADIGKVISADTKKDNNKGDNKGNPKSNNKGSSKDDNKFIDRGWNRGNHSSGGGTGIGAPTQNPQKGNVIRKDDKPGDDSRNDDDGKNDNKQNADDRKNEDRSNDQKGGQGEVKNTSDGRHNGVSEDDKKQDDRKNNSSSKNNTRNNDQSTGKQNDKNSVKSSDQGKKNENKNDRNDDRNQGKNSSNGKGSNEGKNGRGQGIHN
ncbi:anti-sigma factor domain-containing protein [Paenibacillus lignilyticus]|uniref:Anti-sigma factor domain-containing protein n=1 Tax=Paenibacillus lignilyticus TaxID=1172615 RepID=A0ABS5CIL2_9BACL|nr:anti-sigma factor domain-containing protein [Paenibacillus lignilyticus]MBP3965706.1 anti-sigma factor domain-containing protein [Paenibacillus lignilyticus]